MWNLRGHELPVRCRPIQDRTEQYLLNKSVSVGRRYICCEKFVQFPRFKRSVRMQENAIGQGLMPKAQHLINTPKTCGDLASSRGPSSRSSTWSGCASRAIRSTNTGDGCAWHARASSLPERVRHSHGAVCDVSVRHRSEQTRVWQIRDGCALVAARVATTSRGLLGLPRTATTALGN